MVNKTFKLVLCLALVAFASTMLMAQHRPLSVHVTPSTMITPTAKAPAGFHTLYSNLGPANNAYYDADGWLVTGPNSALGESQWIAIPFTLSVNATVTALQAAVGYDGSGRNVFFLGVYSDNGGVVGDQLASGTVSNAPNFGTCCALSTAKMTPSVKVTAGTQYWMVAYTSNSGAGSDFYGAWAFAINDHFDYNVESAGWTDSLSFTGIPAGAVLGTVP